MPSENPLGSDNGYPTRLPKDRLVSNRIARNFRLFWVESGLVRGDRRGCRGLARVALPDAFPAGCAETRAKLGIAEQPLERGAERHDLAGLNEQAGLAVDDRFRES